METLKKELQNLKTWDTVDYTNFPQSYKGYPKINTYGHGYLAIYKTDKNAHIVENNNLATFTGDLAYYLEEDCDATKFLALIV